MQILGKEKPSRSNKRDCNDGKRVSAPDGKRDKPNRETKMKFDLPGYDAWKTEDQEAYLRKIQESRFDPLALCPECGHPMGCHIIGGPGPYHPEKA